MFLGFLTLLFIMSLFWFVYIKFIFKYLVLQRKIDEDIELINKKFDKLI